MLLAVESRVRLLERDHLQQDYNDIVTMLDVSDNPITMEGAGLILQSAVDNGVCEEGYSGNEEDDATEKMNRMLCYML